MKQLSRRIRLLEQQAGVADSKVYFIEALDLSDVELENELQSIKQRDPNAIIFIDDVPLGDEADGY